MAFDKEIIADNTLIEYKHVNGYVKLAKVERKTICKYGYRFGNKTITYEVRYSGNGINWTTCATYPSITKYKMHKHFHEACKALQDGLKIKSTGLICAKV